MQGTLDGESLDAPLSVGPEAVREALRTPSFTPEDFIVARRHLPINQLRSDLNDVLRSLKLELVDLINNDYAKFISLSTNLVGVDTMIESIAAPLRSIQLSAKEIKGSIDAAIERLESGLERRALIRTKRAALEVFLEIHQSLEKVEAVIESSSSTHNTSPQRETSSEPNKIDQKLIERVAIEYNQLQYLVSRGKDFAFVSNISWRIEKIKNTLVSTLSDYVRQAYIAVAADPADVDAGSSLAQTLRVFVLIDRIPDALAVFQECVLDPFVKENVRADLSSMSTNSSPLQDMYTGFIQFIRTRCLRISEITSTAFKGTPYDLLCDTIYTTYIDAIITQLPIIFNAGIPDVFHANYRTSMSFVSQFERLFKTVDEVVALRKRRSYIEFIRKWQLSIYFQIRYNEVASKFEASLATGSDAIGNAEDTLAAAGLKLKASAALFSALARCWSDQVYLSSLAHRFWRFSVMLVLRYSDWLNAAVMDESSNDAAQAVPDSATMSQSVAPNTSLSSLPTAISSSGINLNVDENVLVGQWMSLHGDAVKIRERAMAFLMKEIIPKLRTDPKGDVSVFEDAFSAAFDEIQTTVPILSSRIVGYLSRKCADPILAGVRNIPAMYRRTGRDAPTKCSYFIPTAFRPLTAFMQAHQHVVDNAVMDEWQGAVVRSVSQKYLESVRDMLASVRAVEESLKKLKKAKKAAAGDGSATLSDEDKVRMQIQLDADQFNREETAQQQQQQQTPMRFLENLRALRQSPAFAGMREWYANQMGYRQLGLRFDDMVPDEGPLVSEALRRLPPGEFQDRNFRFKRAFNLSLHKVEAPKEEWTTPETDVSYLRPLISIVESEVATKETFDNLNTIPAALLKRNRSS